MSLRPTRPLRVPLAALLLAASGCERPPTPTAPVMPAARRPSALLGEVAGVAWRLLTCPAGPALSTRGVIGPEGGALAVGGFRIDFPAGAVAAGQEFVLDVGAGDAVAIEAHAVGHARYDFAVPVTVTMSVAHCGLLPAGLHVLHVDPQTGAALEDMGGQLDVLAGSMRFRTPHFSGYTIAWRSGDGSDSLP